MIKIKKTEYSLFAITFSILTLTVGITKILKVLKDTLVVTNPEIGAQLIPFLKTWALIPLSLLCIKFLMQIRHRFSYRQTYCIIGLFFLSFLSFYIFLLRDLEAWICPNAFFNKLDIPNAFKGLLLMVEYWPLSLFYVTCDLWSIVMLSMLFWVYIGELVSMEQGKRFFPIYSLDPSGILIGPLVAASLYIAAGAWERQLQQLMLLVIFLGLLQMGLFLRLCQRTGKEPPLSMNKSGMNWREILNMIRHPFLGFLAIAVFLFEFTDNLFDILWKGTLGLYVPEPEKFSSYLANVASFSGILATLVALACSQALLKRYSWAHVALVPPLLLGALSLCFFSCTFYPGFASWIGKPWGMTGLGITVSIGAIQTCMMSTAKQTLFDNTRDLAFQACQPEERGLGRSFSDAFATRLGKSTSSFTHQSFMISGATLGVAAPYIALMIGASIPVWIGAIIIIGRHFTKRSYQELVL